MSYPETLDAMVEERVLARVELMQAEIERLRREYKALDWLYKSTMIDFDVLQQKSLAQERMLRRLMAFIKSTHEETTRIIEGSNNE